VYFHKIYIYIRRRIDFGLQRYVDLVDYGKASIRPFKQNPEFL
jgi:hypothetical protein